MGEGQALLQRTLHAAWLNVFCDVLSGVGRNLLIRTEVGFLNRIFINILTRKIDNFLSGFYTDHYIGVCVGLINLLGSGRCVGTVFIHNDLCEGPAHG